MSTNQNLKGIVRKLSWEEEMKDFLTDLPKNEDIEYCEDSDFKYFIFYVTGQEYDYPGDPLIDNAVSFKIII